MRVSQVQHLPVGQRAMIEAIRKFKAYQIPAAQRCVTVDVLQTLVLEFFFASEIRRSEQAQKIQAGGDRKTPAKPCSVVSPTRQLEDNHP
jgi:hypothetical protein